MTFMDKASNQSCNPQNNFKFTNRDEPYCTHHKFQGHTLEKCYKLHGHAPGYKSKNKSNHVDVVNTNEDPKIQMSNINND